MTQRGTRENFNYCLEDKFHLEDLENRKLYIIDEIDEFVIEETAYHILRFNAQDKEKLPEQRQPIFLYISSNGGSVADGFALIDVILNSKTPIYTVNLSYNYSMAFLIFLAGSKRFATSNATFLMHDGNSFMYNSMAKIRDAVKFQEQQENRIKSYIISRSKLTEEEYEKNYRVEWYMFPNTAKEKGFVDFIVGEDCDLDGII